MTNYVERQGANLRADLEPNAFVVLPERALRVTNVREVTWAGPRRVAVEIAADGAGARWTLRYELGVIKRERWYVRSVGIDPTERSGR